MNKTRRRPLCCPIQILLASAVLALFSPACILQVKADPVENEYVILFEPHALASLARERAQTDEDLKPADELSLRRNIAAALGAEVITEYSTLPAIHVRLDTTQIPAEALRRVNQFRAISAIEPNYYLHSLETPNEPIYSFGLMWGLNNTGQWGGVEDVDIDAEEAWDITSGDGRVVVGIIDTGILYTHPDLSENIWTNPDEIAGNSIDDDNNGFIDDVHGWDFFNKEGDPLDDNFHGTHVSGIIGAAGNNSRGVVGVNWQVGLMGLKILDKNGVGDTADAARAIDYAILMKRRGVNIRVLNASFGGGEESEVFRSAIQAANEEGILFVTAAGNDGSDNDAKPVFPSSYPLPNLISVASITRSGMLSSFSNYGRNSVDIAAPGSHIWSTFIYNFYFFFDGTSMAAPYVSGIAALLLSNEPDLSPAQTKARLVNTAKGLTGTEGKLKNPAMPSAFHALANIPAPTIQTGTDGSTGESSNALENLGKLLFRIGDSDQDGVDDQQETVDATNAGDRGSFKFRLTSPAFTKYNTYFGQWNFLELISSGREAVEATITVFDSAGRRINRARVVIPPGSQSDISIHDMVGREDAYGLVRIDFNDDSAAALSGRMSNYLNNPDGSYSFAFARELRNATHGTTYAVGNSFDPQGQGYLVPNWAEILNLELLPHRFRYRLYDQGGKLVHSQLITVPPLGEFDLAAGHQFGQGVFLAEITPEISSFAYLAAVARYSSNSAPGSSLSTYAYAFAVDARSGTGSQQLLAISNKTGACWRQANWVEVTNVTGKPVTADLIFRNSAGTTQQELSFTLPAKSQRHFEAGRLLKTNDVGSAELRANRTSSLIAQSLVYFYDCQTNGLQTAYVSPGRIPLAGDLAGSVNTYLGMTNLLTVCRVKNRPHMSLQMLAGNEVILQDPFPLGTEATAQINLNGYLPANTYRLLSLRPGIGHKTVAESLRLREVNGRADFAMPTAVFHTK